MVIQHGLPTHSNFAALLPTSYVKPTLDALEPGYVNPVLHLRDPSTQVDFHAEVLAISTFTLQELKNQSLISLWAYGHPPDIVITELQRRYPEVRKTNSVRLVLFKKL